MQATIDGETPRFMIYDAEALLLASLFLILLFSSSRFHHKRCSKNQTQDKEYEKVVALRSDVIKSFYY
jgi:hypothetical protein